MGKNTTKLYKDYPQTASKKQDSHQILPSFPTFTILK